MKKIIWTLIITIMFILGFGAWDIRQNNIKSIVSGQAHAGIFDDITDAISGHIDDAKDRFKDDEFISGVVKMRSSFTWSSDSIHYANGGLQIVENKGKSYVQLNKDFSAGFAPDLYIYISKGHITSDDQFKSSMKVELGKLIKGSGASFYEIPGYLMKYADKEFSVVIHCKRFNEPMGAAHFN